MSTMAVLARSSADATYTADGMFVRLAGELDSQSLSQLRSTLLSRITVSTGYQN